MHFINPLHFLEGLEAITVDGIYEESNCGEKGYHGTNFSSDVYQSVFSHFCKDLLIAERNPKWCVIIVFNVEIWNISKILISM